MELDFGGGGEGESAKEEGWEGVCERPRNPSRCDKRDCGDLVWCGFRLSI